MLVFPLSSLHTHNTHRLSMPPPPDCLANWLMSKPAENARSPAPVTTMAATAGAACARRRQSKRACRTVERWAGKRKGVVREGRRARARDGTFYSMPAQPAAVPAGGRVDDAAAGARATARVPHASRAGVGGREKQGRGTARPTRLPFGMAAASQLPLRARGLPSFPGPHSPRASKTRHSSFFFLPVFPTHRPGAAR